MDILEEIAFERNNTDRFDIPFADLGGDLGRIYQIQVRSDNRYAGSNWLLSFIEVTRLENDGSEFANKPSRFQINKWFKKESATYTLDRDWSSIVKFKTRNIEYKRHDIYVPAGQHYKRTVTETTTSGFKYSTIKTVENTSKFNFEMGSKTSSEVVMELAEGLKATKANEAFLKFGFEKGTTETTVDESTRTEEKTLEVREEIEYTNSSSKDKHLQAIFTLVQIDAVIAIDGIVGSFSVGHEIVYSGLLDTETQQIISPPQKAG